MPVFVHVIPTFPKRRTGDIAVFRNASMDHSGVVDGENKRRRMIRSIPSRVKHPEI